MRAGERINTALSDLSIKRWR